MAQVCGWDWVSGCGTLAWHIMSSHFTVALEALQPNKTAQVSKQQVVAMVTEPEVPAEPPPEYEFMVDPPAISRRHL